MAWEWSPFGALVGEERVGGRGMDGLSWRRHRFGGVEILDVVGAMSARRVSRDLLRLSPRCGGCQGHGMCWAEGKAWSGGRTLFLGPPDGWRRRRVRVRGDALGYGR